jgi:hypothetical protein
MTAESLSARIEIDLINTTTTTTTTHITNNNEANDTSQNNHDNINDNKNDGTAQDYSIVDSYLPEARTCFFTLSLPSYSSKEILQKKLLYAISICKTIDTDFLVNQTQNDREIIIEENINNRHSNIANDYYSGSISILDSEASFYFSELL